MVADDDDVQDDDVKPDAEDTEADEDEFGDEDDEVTTDLDEFEDDAEVGDDDEEEADPVVELTSKEQSARSLEIRRAIERRMEERQLHEDVDYLDLDPDE